MGCIPLTVDGLSQVVWFAADGSSVRGRGSSAPYKPLHNLSRTPGKLLRGGVWVTVDRCSLRDWLPARWSVALSVPSFLKGDYPTWFTAIHSPQAYRPASLAAGWLYVPVGEHPWGLYRPGTLFGGGVLGHPPTTDENIHFTDILSLSVFLCQGG